MALSDHLRELRARLIRSALVLLLAFVVALFFYDQLLELVLGPYDDAAEMLGRRDRHHGVRRRAPPGR